MNDTPMTAVVHLSLRDQVASVAREVALRDLEAGAAGEPAEARDG